MHEQPDNLIDADELVTTYLKRIPRGEELALRDALFHHHLTWLRTIIPVLDRVLRDDGIDRRTRDRIATTLVYGTPDTDKAIAEMRLQETVLDRMENLIIGNPDPNHQFGGILGFTEGGHR